MSPVRVREVGFLFLFAIIVIIIVNLISISIIILVIQAMRLDEYLLCQKFVDSRMRAKRAVKLGFVIVDGVAVTKPSFEVPYGSSVEFDSEGGRSAGFFKLKEIQARCNLIKEGDRVLDIGSSAGGFLMFASQIASEVVGIEFSSDFQDMLQEVCDECPNVQVEFGDAFSFDFSPLGTFDVILNDLTLVPHDSISVLRRVIGSLREGGRVLQVVKLQHAQDMEGMIGELESMGLVVEDVLDAKKREMYVIAKKPRRFEGNDK